MLESTDAEIAQAELNFDLAIANRTADPTPENRMAALNALTQLAEVYDLTFEEDPTPIDPPLRTAEDQAIIAELQAKSAGLTPGSEEHLDTCRQLFEKLL
jgi:hypothetical protein